MCLSDYTGRRFNALKKSVSILVLMDESFRPIALLAISVMKKVSILVLMDESFRRELDEQEYVNYGFHPCFNGCVFQTFQTY